MIENDWRIKGINRTLNLLNSEITFLKKGQPETYTGAIEKLQKIIRLYCNDLQEQLNKK